MLVCISPAKSLDWSGHGHTDTTTPHFAPQAHELAQVARALSATDIKALMHISDDLAQLNYDRFQSYQKNPPSDRTRPAALAFNGD
ncbi:MAG: peroxide stress protein YaaA, partial [Pseudomonadota bacterium]